MKFQDRSVAQCFPCLASNHCPHQIVAWINSHSEDLNATIRYGTLDAYLDIVHHGPSPPTTTANPPFTSAPFDRTHPSTLTFPVVEGELHSDEVSCMLRSCLQVISLPMMMTAAKLASSGADHMLIS